MIRCPQCNYDLAGTTTGPCPECGATVDRVALAAALIDSRRPLRPGERRAFIIAGSVLCALPLIFALIPIPCAWYVDRTLPMGLVISNHPGTPTTTAIYLWWSVCGCFLMPFWSPIIALSLLRTHRRSFDQPLLRRLAITWITLIALAACTPLLYKFWPYASRAWGWWVD